MALGDERLKQFFSKQKVGAFDALKQPAKANIDKRNVYNKVYNTNEPKLASLATQAIQDATIQSTSSNLLETQPNILEVEEKKQKDEPLAFREQTVSIPLALREQPVSDPLPMREQSASIPLANPLAEPLANREENYIVDLRIFSKKERELLTLIFWQCHSNCSLISPPISTEEIRHTLKISAERVRNLIYRISKKGGVRIAQHKSGQNAYRVFEIPKSLYQWMADQRSHRLSEPLANALSSSNLLNNKKTTTSLPDDWKNINFELLRDVGFSETQLKQLFDTGITTPEVVQDSINHFSYGLQYNEKMKTYKDPLNVFMGVLRKGQKWNEADYISPKDLALQQVLEGKKKAKEKREAMIKEMADMEFPEWREKLTDNQIKMIVPESTLRLNISAATNAALRSHYVENILLSKLEKMEMTE